MMRGFLRLRGRLRTCTVLAVSLGVATCATCERERAPRAPRLVVFSGGTAFNTLAEPLSSSCPNVAHVLPVSDDGGSTAEILRVLGGPAIGDIRSRCLRLSDTSTSEARAVKALLGHRLSKDGAVAKREWAEIVEGESPLWDGLSAPYRDTIRPFLVHFHHEVLHRATSTSPPFDFANGSIGNYFFAGARTFLCSLEAALFLYARVSRIPPETSVLPVMRVRSRDRVTLGAELRDGTLLHGQNSISHPPPPPSLEQRPSVVDKECEQPLGSPIRRVFFAATEPGADGGRNEVRHSAHPAVVQRLHEADAIIYGMGSLWTSICPCLVVSGVAEAISGGGSSPDSISGGTRPKVLMLNGSHDRETRGMDAVAVVHAVVDSLNQGRDDGKHLPPSAYVNVLLVPRGGAFAVDEAALRAMGIRRVVEVASELDSKGRVVYAVDAGVEALCACAGE